MSNIELYSKLQNPIDAIHAIGQMFAKSGMFGCERAEQGEVLAMICLAEQKSPVAITRDYDIVEGKLRKKALAALADFRNGGGKHKWLASGDEPATRDEDRKATLQLTDKDGNTITYSYSIADARLEGLVRDKSRWVKRPGNMLRARCISNGLGMLCPELYAGDDGSGDEQERTAPTINLATTAPQDVKAEKAEAVVEVKAEVVAEPEPKPQPAAEKPFAAGPSYAAPTGTQLPEQLVRDVEAAIGEHAVAAVTWMIKEGWLASGQGLEFLTEARARRIIKQRDSFLRAVGGAK